MTKAEIVNEIALSTGVQRNVYLRGFGSFIIKHRAAKTARNISKNITITIDAHDLPSFKPSKSFVAQMNQE